MIALSQIQIDGSQTRTKPEDLTGVIQMQSQWQPIETAPKDGTVILVNNPIKSYSNKKYYKYPVVMAWANRYMTEGRESYYWKSFNHGYPKPTHWMPLPEPPK